MRPTSLRRAVLASGLLFCLLALGSAAAEAGLRAPLRGDGDLEFVADMPLFPLDGGGTRLDLAVRVDHDQLDFRLLRGRFVARVELSLKLARRGDVALDSTVVHLLEAVDAADAASPRRFQLLEMSVPVRAGRWAVTLELREPASGSSGSASGVLSVPRWMPGEPRLSDPEFRLTSGSERLPNPARLYGVSQDTLSLYLELRDAPVGEPQDVTVEIFDPAYGAMDEQLVRLTPEADHVGSLVRVPLLTLPDGNYVLRLTPAWAADLATENDFTVSWRVERVVQPARDVQIEARLLLDPRELDAFQAMSRPAQSQRMQRFWDERDPTPGTVRNELHERFLERVEYARRNFGEFGTPGPLSDRGRIYIRYGAPAEINREVIPTDKEDLEEAIASVHDAFRPELWGTEARNQRDKASVFGEQEQLSADALIAERDRLRNQQRIGREGSFELWIYHLDGDPLLPDETSTWTENLDMRFLFVDRLGTGVYRLDFDNLGTRY